MKSPARMPGESGTGGAGMSAGWTASAMETPLAGSNGHGIEFHIMPTGVPPPAASLLLRGGSVIDGTGAPAIPAEVLITDARVAGLLPPGTAVDAEVVEIAGKVVCPGFVDIHTHSDLTLLSDPRGQSKVRQGVTTEVVGNCGLGVVPRPAADPVGMRAAVAYLDLDPAVRLDQTDLTGYLDALERVGPAVNVAALVAHLPLRWGVRQGVAGPVTDTELTRMRDLLAEALDQGALGLSTGLIYPPLQHADHRELCALAEMVTERDKLFAWHIRDYTDGLLESVAEVLAVARETGCRTQISHLMSVGRRNRGVVGEALAMIDRARADGLDIGVDIYPYLAGNAPLAQLLPGWLPVGGQRAVLLRDPATRQRIAAEWEHNPVGWDEIMICAMPGEDQSLVGRILDESAAELGRPAAELALDLLAEHDNAVMMVAFGRAEEDLRQVLAHPATVVASDGQALADTGATAGGVPHPRSFGCFPRYLSEFAPDLVEGVRRCTSAPADRVGLDRGRIAVGAVADLVVLDPQRLADRSSFTRPRMEPAGIELVLVGGRPVAADAEPGSGTGAVIRMTKGTR
ncbi:N-acyl-D-amino-acid deacylase [Enemella evansiae]|nr:N-acyl-D-amino-acid deacylase [Enemella evansiae]